MNNSEWKIFRGSPERTPGAVIDQWLEALPPWRRLARPSQTVDRQVPLDETADRRGNAYVCSGHDELLRVNMALMLRRPLLITGAPGLGKSTLAYSIAWCLGLGAPLRWEINSRTTLQDGLYTYDAVGHLHASQNPTQEAPIGDFITLGPLGTALLPTPRPRVLLVDELDKASFDLPNDLLHVFEEGAFALPELVRLGGKQAVYAFDSRSGDDRVLVSEGRISTLHHPVVVVTSNGERSFSEAFLRRCVRLDLKQPGREHLERVVTSQLGDSLPAELVGQALERYKDQTTDVLLQALFLEHTYGVGADDVDHALRREN
jgi:MoxR-like ATPase